jgi:hypothetical protein
MVVGEAVNVFDSISNVNTKSMQNLYFQHTSLFEVFQSLKVSERVRSVSLERFD